MSTGSHSPSGDSVGGEGDEDMNAPRSPSPDNDEANYDYYEGEEDSQPAGDEDDSNNEAIRRDTSSEEAPNSPPNSPSQQEGVENEEVVTGEQQQFVQSPPFDPDVTDQFAPESPKDDAVMDNIFGDGSQENAGSGSIVDQGGDHHEKAVADSTTGEEGEEGEDRPSYAPHSDDDDGYDALPKKKIRVAVSSEEEDEDRAVASGGTGREEGQREEVDEEQKPLRKKRRAVSSESDSDDEANEGEKLKKRLLGSDDEEDEVEGGEKKRVDSQENDVDSDGEGFGTGEEKSIKELMADVFGSDVDDDEDDDDAGRPRDEHHRKETHGERAEGEGEDGEPRFVREDAGDIDDRDPDFEWDFDRMMKEKKAEKGRKRRRRKDGGIDIINDDDGTIMKMIDEMKQAAKEDRNSNMDRKPAVKKRMMLPKVRDQLRRVDLIETHIDNGMLSAVSEWLAPLPDKSLPALEVRTTLLKILKSFGRLEQGVLKQSGLGKAVMLLFKHPRETKENKRLAQELIADWARPIFQLDTDYASLTREERMQRDMEHAAKRRRMSHDGDVAGPSQQRTPSERTLKPGEKGFIGRARVPMPSTKDYVNRPQHAVEGPFRGASKSKGNTRLEKAVREFKERNRQQKAKRAVGVSIEGRKMDL